MAGQPYVVSAPADIEFQLQADGPIYRVSGDPDVELIATLLDVEESLHNAAGLTKEEVTFTLTRGREILLGLIQEKLPEVDDFHIGVSGLLQIIGLIVGNSSVAQEVAETLAAAATSGEPGEEDDEAAAVKRAEAEAGGTEDAEPVPLDRRSQKSSSASAKRGSGRRTGGKAAPGASSEPTSRSRRAATG